LQLVRAERGNPVWVRPDVGRWADREESRSLGGNGMTEKRMPAAERQQETGTYGWPLRPVVPWITGRIPGLCPGPKGC